MIQVCFHWLPSNKYCQHQRQFESDAHAQNFIRFMERKYPNFILDEVFTSQKTA